MKTNEFKAWFEGFTEALDGPPNEAQWKRIREMVGKIDGVPVTEKVFIDRYWPTRRQWWELAPYQPYSVWSCSTPVGGQVSNSLGAGAAAFDGPTAMYAAGKAEAAQGSVSAQ